MSEEPFGPVAVINRFGMLDEAIAEANRLPFGLAAYAFTRSGATATRLGNEVEAGMTTINHLGLAFPEVPFGGIKESGYGTEGGSEALEAVSRVIDQWRGEDAGELKRHLAEAKDSISELGDAVTEAAAGQASVNAAASVAMSLRRIITVVSPAD